MFPLSDGLLSHRQEFRLGRLHNDTSCVDSCPDVTITETVEQISLCNKNSSLFSVESESRLQRRKKHFNMNISFFFAAFIS